MSIALLFASIFLFGGRGAFHLGHQAYRRFLSFAAGIAVAYVFVDVMPALDRMQSLVLKTQSSFHVFFPEYSVYLWAMAGFLLFYCLETLVVDSSSEPDNQTDGHSATASLLAWLHIMGFAVYAWMLSYVMVWKIHDALALCLYAVAMGMHIFPITCNLGSHYPSEYNHRGAILLALASLAGWLTGRFLEIPVPILVNLMAVVVGGVIVNTAITELPKQGEGRRSYFLTGAISYTALLLILSHFEKGGAM